MVCWTLYHLGNRDEFETPLSLWKLGEESFNFIQKWWPVGAATQMKHPSAKTKDFPQHILWALGLHVAVPAATGRAVQVPCFTESVRPSGGVPTLRLEHQENSGGQNHPLVSRPFPALIFP